MSRRIINWHTYLKCSINLLHVLCINAAWLIVTAQQGWMMKRTLLFSEAWWAYWISWRGIVHYFLAASGSSPMQINNSIALLPPHHITTYIYHVFFNLLFFFFFSNHGCKLWDQLFLMTRSMNKLDSWQSAAFELNSIIEAMARQGMVFIR